MKSWLDKVVEHKTPTGKVTKVKVKSLPPEEQKKYKPKKKKPKKPLGLQKQDVKKIVKLKKKTPNIQQDIKKLVKLKTPQQKIQKPPELKQDVNKLVNLNNTQDKNKHIEVLQKYLKTSAGSDLKEHLEDLDAETIFDDWMWMAKGKDKKSLEKLRDSILNKPNRMFDNNELESMLGKKTFDKIKSRKEEFGKVKQKIESKQKIISSLSKEYTDYHELYHSVKVDFLRSDFASTVKKLDKKKLKPFINRYLIEDGWLDSATSPRAVVLMSLSKSAGLSKSEQQIDDEDLISLCGGEEHFKKLKDGVIDIYKETQDKLKKRNIDKVKIYRGVNETYLLHRPLESWTTNKTIAKRFGDKVIEDVVDSKDILVDLSKNPSYDEKEVVKLSRIVSFLYR